MICLSSAVFFFFFALHEKKQSNTSMDGLTEKYATRECRHIRYSDSFNKYSTLSESRIWQYQGMQNITGRDLIDAEYFALSFIPIHHTIDLDSKRST